MENLIKDRYTPLQTIFGAMMKYCAHDNQGRLVGLEVSPQSFHVWLPVQPAHCGSSNSISFVHFSAAILNIFKYALEVMVDFSEVFLEYVGILVLIGFDGAIEADQFRRKELQLFGGFRDLGRGGLVTTV